jgi:hypothetical protein
MISLNLQETFRSGAFSRCLQQVRADHQSNARCMGPGLRRDDENRSRDTLRPSFPISLSLLEEEGAGNAGCALHPRSRVPRIAHLAHTSIQVSGNTPTSPAQWLYGLSRALPGERAFLPPSPADNSTSLAPASRRQDHTTSPYASVQSSTEQKRPPHPIPTFGGDGQRPSSGMRRGSCNSDFRKWEAKYFCCRG